MEGHIHEIRAWSDFGDADVFRSLRTAGVAERMVMEDNFFIEILLPAGMQRQLSNTELDAYRAPFLDPAGRTPMLVWPREIPIAGQPADVVEMVRRNQSIIADPQIKKLLMYANPGAVIQADEVVWCQQHGRDLDLADVGSGTHFLPEDCPEEIAAAINHWLTFTKF